MATAADRNARRRLQTLLDSEEYGPALARLRGEDERRVLRLIDSNRGAEARREILAADERRRVRVRTERRRQLLERAVRHTIDIHAPYYPVRDSSVRRNLTTATDAELRFAATATRDQMVERARQPPAELPPRETNPFWYH